MFQDLIDKPKYTLLLVNGSSSQRFFSLAAEKNPDSEEGILWKRALENPDSSIKNYEMAENMMLENPYLVLFAPEAIAKFRFSNYPCLIYSSSKILATVSLSVNGIKHSIQIMMQQRIVLAIYFKHLLTFYIRLIFLKKFKLFNQVIITFIS